MLLGFHSTPVSLVMPVTLHGFSYARFLLARTDTFLGPYAFLRNRHIDVYIRGFVSSFSEHSNHEHFIDLRHISNTIRLRIAFVWLVFIQQFLRLPSADFSGLHTSRLSPYDACRSIKESVSGRYPFIPLFRISVRKRLCFSRCFYLLTGRSPI